MGEKVYKGLQACSMGPDAIPQAFCLKGSIDGTSHLLDGEIKTCS